jgi:uncharacterized protein (DUF433 family)
MATSKIKIKTETPKIGEGIYLPVDVSQILKLDYHRVKYLMNTFWKDYTFGGKRNKAINFFSLIEFYTYYHLREKGFTSQHIKNFHKNLAGNLNTPYPFASVRVVDRTGLNGKTRNSKIWYECMGELMRDDRVGQSSISEFVKPFLKQVDFGEDQLAKRFYPLHNTRNIIVDPLHQFGQPVISGTNIQTKAIFNLYDIGETKANICKLYDISVNQVDDAIQLHTRKAA